MAEGGSFVKRVGGTRLVVSEGDLESVSSLFGQIMALRRRGGFGSTGSQQRDDGAALDAHVRVIMRTMKERLVSLKDGPLQAKQLHYSYSCKQVDLEREQWNDAEVVMAKHDLYSICFQELILVADAITPGLRRALENLRDAHESLLQDVPGIVQRTLDGYQQEVFRLHADKQRNAKEAGELVQAAQALERETIAQHEELGRLHDRLKELEEENAALRTTQNAAGQTSLLPTRPRTTLHKVGTDGLNDTTTTSARETKGLAVAGVSKTHCDDHHRGGLGQGVSLEPSPYNVRFCWNQSRSGPTAEGKAWATTTAAAESGLAVDGRRELSLKQLHDLIASVYASKAKYDRHCVAQRLPSQTLSRHLDDFLVHRYGLTSMAKAQATALRKGVEKFRDDDNTVKVFELTLRNEVHEGFQQHQRDLEKTVSDFIRSRIRERVARHEQATKVDDRYSYRRFGSSSISRAGARNLAADNHRHGGAGGASIACSAAAVAASSTIETLLRSQTRPTAPLASADWQAVLRHVYRETATTDAKTVGILVKEAISAKRAEAEKGLDSCEPTSRKGAVGAGQGQSSVPYGLFMQVLLGYQLHGYLRRVEAFREDFRKLDVDADGVLNSAQFLALAKRTVGRLKKSTMSPRETQCPPRRTIEDGGSPIEPGQYGRHRLAMTAAKGQIKSAAQQAAALLKAADPNDNLDKVNPRYPLTGGGAAHSAVDGLLCVQYDNSASKGEFFEDPGTLPISIFGDSGSSEFSYHDNLAEASAQRATETDSFFDKGDRIPAAFMDEADGGTVAAFGGYFPLPVADDAGRCNEANFAGFGIPVPANRGEENSCSREVESLESQCSSVFGWERFTSQLYAATVGTAAPAPVVVAGEYTSVEISSVTWRDWDTGEETDFTEVNCEAFYYDGGGGERGGTPAPVSHDGEGSITGVTAAVVLTDIPPGSIEGSSAASSSQQFSVEFRLEPTSDAFSEMTRSQDLGNLVDRDRSGNPGYLPGLPVLAGRLESSEDFEYVAPGGTGGGGGLELMVGEGKGCDDVGTSPVEFVYDAFGCCVLSLTREALAEHCAGSGQYVDPETGFTPLAFHNTSSSVEYLGSYGNADPLDVSQWVEMPVTSSADTASWDDESGVCSSTVSTLEYQVLYAPVGAAANPQSKIVSAAVRYGKSDWVWREEASTEQNFLVCNSVSFKVFEQEMQRYTPPSPPVAFTVPWDVFYPFFISTSGVAASGTAPSRYAAAVSIAAALGPAVLALFVPEHALF
eukprot:g6208.t2